MLLGLILIPNTLYAQSKLIKNLSNGTKQTLVIYGTSLSAAAGGKAWVGFVDSALNNRYSNNLKVINSAKSAMWSTWGIQHLEDSVISKKPDAVLIEFSINDAFLNYKTSPELASLNLRYMVDRIKLSNPDCEIILQVMNIPLNASADARPRLSDYNEMYRKVAKEKGLLLIDHYPNWEKILAMGKDVYLTYVPDGIHPNEKSARSIIAPFILKKLEEGK
jgi:acyl-CoA thioesterase-1